jgi:hypothetical protein
MPSTHPSAWPSVETRRKSPTEVLIVIGFELWFLAHRDWACRRLRDAGRMDLESKIEWGSQTRGDGAGYSAVHSQ